MSNADTSIKSVTEGIIPDVNDVIVDITGTVFYATTSTSTVFIAIAGKLNVGALNLPDVGTSDIKATVMGVMRQEPSMSRKTPVTSHMPRPLVAFVRLYRCCLTYHACIDLVIVASHFILATSCSVRYFIIADL